MDKSLDYYTPRWAVARIINKLCSCGRAYTRSDIVQIGIRKVSRNGRNFEALAIEVTCPNCEKGAVTTFSQHKDSFRQLLCMLLEEMQKIDRLEKAKEIEHGEYQSSSKISDEEIKIFKDELKKMGSYNDFLKKLGIDTPNES